MNRKDYIIITFFILIFAIVLYQKNFSGPKTGKQSSGSSSGSGSSGSSRSNISKTLSKLKASILNGEEIKPPSGVNRSSYYDENGDFKSYYSGTTIPKEFLTKKEYFTDPDKLKIDMDYKMDKLYWDMGDERREFARTHDIHGSDKEAYEKLISDQKRMREKIFKQNYETWQELKREVRYHYSDLR